MASASDNAVPAAEVIPLTIGESAYRRIRSDIIFGRIPPGRKLRLDRMKAEYGASISTVREILNRLAAEGFVIAEGQRGFEVPPVTAQNLRELAALRLLLEGHAMEQSFADGDLEWEGRIVAAHHKLDLMEQRMLAGDRSETEIWKRYDWEFHQALIAACGSTVLMEVHGSVFDRYLRYQRIALSFRRGVAAREHRLLLEYALARDVPRAQAILAEHLEGGVRHALESGRV
jgi:DNA-binding GntR family transcriptional regulator